MLDSAIARRFTATDAPACSLDMTAAVVDAETQDKEDQTRNFLDYIVVCHSGQCIGECLRLSFAMLFRLSSPRLSPHLIKKHKIGKD